MASSKSGNARRDLHLSIDPSPYEANCRLSSESSTPSSASARGSTDTYPTSPSSSGSDLGVVFSVLCFYDFQSDDPSHLPFYKNELLDIVKQEDSGWWAAMRRGGNIIGWVPQAFVRPLSPDMTDRLRHVREELRVFEYDAEQLYQSAPILRIPFDSEEEQRPSPESQTRPMLVDRPHPPPSPITPTPKPPQFYMTRKSSTASLLKSDPISRGKIQTLSPLRRQDVARAIPILPPPPSEHVNLDGAADTSLSADKRRQAIIKKLTGSDDAVNYVNTVNSPWFTKSKYADQLKFDHDGQVRSGTLAALVEKLTTDTSKDAISTCVSTTIVLKLIISSRGGER